MLNGKNTDTLDSEKNYITELSFWFSKECEWEGKGSKECDWEGKCPESEPLFILSPKHVSMFSVWQ